MLKDIFENYTMGEIFEDVAGVVILFSIPFLFKYAVAIFAAIF